VVPTPTLELAPSIDIIGLAVVDVDIRNPFTTLFITAVDAFKVNESVAAFPIVVFPVELKSLTVISSEDDTPPVLFRSTEAENAMQYDNKQKIITKNLFIV
jgi:hypothetical protein